MHCDGEYAHAYTYEHASASSQQIIKSTGKERLIAQ